MDAVHAIVVLTYIVLVPAGVGEDAVRAFLRRIAASRVEELMTTWMRKYVDQGCAEGKTEGKAEILLPQLRRRFGSLAPAIEARVRTAESDRIDVYGPPPPCKDFGCLMKKPVLAVVYPACLRGSRPLALMDSADRQPDKWASRDARIVSWAFADPGPTGSPSLSLTLASRHPGGGAPNRLRGARQRWAVRFGPGQHRPDRPRHLVCNRRRGEGDRATCDQRCQPRPRRDVGPLGRADKRTSAMDEKGAQVAITSLADPADPLAIAAGLRLRCEAQPSGEAPDGLELASIPHGGDQRRRRQDTDAGNRRQPLAGLAVVVPLGTSELDRFGLAGQGIDLVRLVALDVRLHVLGWDQTHLMPEARQFPRPVVRARTRLHGDQTGRQLGEEPGQLAARQTPTKDGAAIGSDTVNLEDGLCEIDTHTHSIHDGSAGRDMTAQLPLNAADAGAVHPIRWSEHVLDARDLTDIFSGGLPH